jgi:hypothetical protein
VVFVGVRLLPALLRVAVSWVAAPPAKGDEVTDCQAPPLQLVSSGNGGDLLLWDLPKEGEPPPPSSTAGSNATSNAKSRRAGGIGVSGAASKFVTPHSRSVFTVHATSRRVMSSSMDRHVASWSIASLKRQWRVGGLGGFVYQLAQSPQHPSLVCALTAPTLRLPPLMDVRTRKRCAERDHTTRGRFDRAIRSPPQRATRPSGCWTRPRGPQQHASAAAKTKQARRHCFGAGCSRW